MSNNDDESAKPVPSAKPTGAKKDLNFFMRSAASKTAKKEAPPNKPSQVSDPVAGQQGALQANTIPPQTHPTSSAAPQPSTSQRNTSTFPAAPESIPQTAPFHGAPDAARQGAAFPAAPESTTPFPESPAHRQQTAPFPASPDHGHQTAPFPASPDQRQQTTASPATPEQAPSTLVSAATSSTKPTPAPATQAPRANHPDEAPRHLTMMSISADYQKLYVDAVKRGKRRSGITKQFGKGADLLVPPAPEPTPIEADPSFEIKTEEELVAKAKILQRMMQEHCQQFLTKYFADAQAGKIDIVAKNAINKSSPETAKVVLKELVCANLYLAVLDQGEIEKVAEWLQGFLGEAFVQSNSIIAKPGAFDIMQSYSSTIGYGLCKSVADRIGHHLHFAELSDDSTLPFYEILYRGSAARRHLIQSALRSPVD